MSSQKSRIMAIIGQGYVGLPLAMAAVDAGWTVVGVDNLASKVASLNSGLSPVEDITDSHLKSAIESNKYSATTDFSKVSAAEVIAICVPTPLDSERKPDLSLLCNAAKEIAPHISNETLIVSESTSYPGTLRNEIIPIIDLHKQSSSLTIYFASAPERVNPGDLIWNQKNTPRLIGAINEESKMRAIEFYDSICNFTVSVSTPEVAEAAKLLENTFRLVNIALVNEFTQICELTGINVNEVITAAETKPYGFMSFRPGVGVGGHCIPVDPLYLTWWAEQNGRKAKIVELADSINQLMPKYVAERAMKLNDSELSKFRVLIIGVAYKPGVSDVRETPMTELYDSLENLGALVAWYDPLVEEWHGSKPVDLSWECDLAILATKQPSLDLQDLTARGVKILDCTNSLQNDTCVFRL